jgi:hypothetical protein
VFFQQVAVALVGLGREKFKGNDRFPGRLFLGKDVADESHVVRQKLARQDRLIANLKSTYLDTMIC